MNGRRGTGTRGNRRGRSRGPGYPGVARSPGRGGTGDRRAARWTPGIGGAPANCGARSSGEHRAAGARGRCGADLGRRRTAPVRPGEGPYGGGPRAGGGLAGEPQVSPGLRRRRGLGGEARGDWPGAFLGRGSRMGGPCCPRGLKTSVAVGRPGGGGVGTARAPGGLSGDGGRTGGPGLPRGGAGGRWPEGVHGTGANTGSPGLSGAYAGRESRMGRPLGRGARGEAWGNGLPSGPGPGGRGRRSRTRAGEAGPRGRGVTGSRVMPGVPDGRGPHRCHRRGALVQPRTARPAPRIGPGNPPRLPAGEGQSPVIGPVPRGQSAPHSPTPALRGEP